MKSDTLIRFSWMGILEYYAYDCKKALLCLQKIITGHYPHTEHSLIKAIQKNPKDCWLLKPTSFLVNGATANEKCVYLHLASQRHWLDYEQFKITHLDFLYAQEFYSIEALKSNPLLTIKKEFNLIDFKY